MKWQNVEIMIGTDEQSDTVKVGHKRYKQVVKGISGHSNPGELLAIVGPSGCGKTTLLHYIGQRHPKSQDLIISEESELTVNGQPFDSDQFKTFGAVIEQDDCMYESSTPAELFEFAAMVRTSLNPAQINDKVQHMLKILGLEECKDTPVGGNFVTGLSGGERKRTSIGYDLMTDPKVIILDEPTSGLDSQTAFQLVRYLKNLAKLKNINVILSLHQPSSQIV